MMTMLLTSCGNATVQKIVDAYKDATSQIDGASDDDECVKIHSDLLDNLCDIVKADPEFLEKVEEKDFSKSDIKLMETAYKEYTDKLQEKVSSERYIFMPFASLENIKNRLNQGSRNDGVSNDEDDKITSTGSEDRDELLESYKDDDDDMSSTGSEDWDELLESYEEYVDKYISYLKKASNGDMDALSEYPALLEKAQEFSENMKNARSDMSTSQWARYNKITSKMLKAAQEMQ
jgi:hypothetical protein